jgi:hypothetical protein
VSFDDALAFLLALVGERVEVVVESPASGLLAHFAGTLVQGHELAPRDEPGSLFFSLDDGATGFVLAPAAVATTTRAPDGDSIRIEDRAGVALIVERGRSAEPA